MNSAEINNDLTSSSVAPPATVVAGGRERRAPPPTLLGTSMNVDRETEMKPVVVDGAAAAAAAPSATEPSLPPLDTQTKLHNLMHLINPSGAFEKEVLPPFDELVRQVNAKQMAEPQPLPALVTADVMDCFRLYFGSSVTIFPFYAARLGAVGFVFVLSAAGYIGLMTQMALHRSRYNLILLELQKRMERETLGVPLIDMSTMTPMSMSSTATPSGSPTSANPTASVIVSPHASPSNPLSAVVTNATDSGESKKEKKRKKKQKPPPNPSDMMPVFFKVDTMVKVCNALWPDHWMKEVFSGITAVAQFFGCCSYTLLFSSNVGPVLGIGHSPAVYLGAAMIALLSLATAPKAKTFLAYINNIFIFAGSCIILYASLTHEKTEEEEAMALQIFPKSTSELAMYAPSVLTYVSAQLLTIDAESIVAMRAYRMLQGKAPEPSPESLATTPATSATTSPVAQHSPGGFPTTGGSVPPTHPTLAAGLFAAAFEGLKADTLRRSLINVQTVQASYTRAVNLGLVLSIIVLLFFAELIMFGLRDSTDAIIALSIPPSGVRTAVLVALAIGLYACAALNIGPICDMIDVFVTEMQQLEFMPIVKKAIARAVLFIAVVAFLWLVPFFDMVAGLSGAICTPMFAFFIPSACEMQSSILRVAARPDQKEAMAAASNVARMLAGWKAMPLRGKVTMAGSMVLGVIILIFSTSSVVAEILRRRSAEL